MILNAAVIALFLLYFWYITGSNFQKKLPIPTMSRTPSQPIGTYNLIKTPNGSQFQFLVDSQVIWETNLPDDYTIHDQQFKLRDACHGQTNGTRVLATGRVLYDFLQKDKLTKTVPPNVPFEPDANRVLQNHHLFYFTCRDDHIDQLHMCPPGTIFKNDHCESIDLCTNHAHGIHLADPYDEFSYYVCEHGKTVRHTCPEHYFFFHDRCIMKDNPPFYCQFNKKPLIVGNTLIICRNGRTHFERCPPGFRYFDKPTCESDACYGQPDDKILPLPEESMGPFHFSPGFRKCRNNKVVEVKRCPQTWDWYHSKGDNLAHLPQVFDGAQCTIPEFCTNVTSSDPDVVVPVMEFTKHVRTWKYSKDFDMVSGYKCEGKTRKRVALPEGQYIDAKRFKAASACDHSNKKVPISQQFHSYYDCDTNQKVVCPPGQVFNGVECSPEIPHAHFYKGIGLFQLDSLDADNWMKVWRYLPKEKHLKSHSLTDVHLENYNVSSHPDCAKFSFLAHFPISIALKDGSVCVHKGQKLVKEPTPNTYLFWSQRQVDPEWMTADECVQGRLQSGDFLLDRTLFATCDEAQPFVFCPSSLTEGIELVDGKRWACQVPGMTIVIPPFSTIGVEQNQIKKITAISKDLTTFSMNKILYTLKEKENFFISTANYFTLKTYDKPVEVTYGYRLTHPPDVVSEDGILKLSTKGGAFLINKKDFTKKPVILPQYTIKESVPDFR